MVLASGVDFNAVTDGIAALQRAALTEVSRTDIVDLLLDWQADVGAGAGARHGTVLQHAASFGQFHIVKTLCKACDTWIRAGDGKFGIRREKREIL